MLVLVVLGTATFVLPAMKPSLANGKAASSGSDAEATPALTLRSDDKPLVAAFDWARRQALAYAFDDDPVGPWYEAALPGREAFCMRDVSHQAAGAHALGLARHTHNMLRRFAAAIADSRDWCGYWEIDREGRPAPVDYKNDAEFWYNLPANFDMLDACYRMYLWTGDRSYLDDPVFRQFYDRTVTDYVDRWSLDLDRIMKRPRLLNLRGGLDREKKFAFFRGIPTYHESRDEYAVGLDLLAVQYAAYQAYARMREMDGDVNTARTFVKKAADVRALANGPWWDAAAKRYYGYLRTDGRFEGEGGTTMLYHGATEPGAKTQGALDVLLDRVAKHTASVEGQSHHAEILYRYGRPDEAYAEMLDLTREDKSRREYPEASFAVVGAFVTGLMGITVEADSPLLAETDGNFVDRVVRTFPGLTKATPWAELRDLPIRKNTIAVRHDGLRQTTFTNARGPALIWQATFPGRFATVLVNGRSEKATVHERAPGREVSSVRVVVGAGDTVRAQVQ